MTTNAIVITAFGADQPGVVATLCKVLTKNQCNIVQMTQSNILNQFSSLFIVDKPSDLANDRLQAELQFGCEQNDLNIHVDVQDKIEPKKLFQKDTEPFVISVYGNDRNDIVGTFAELFGSLEINIDDIRAIQPSKQDFMIVYEVKIPQSIDLRALHQTLLDQARSMGLNLTLQHRHIFEAIHRVQVF